MTVQVSKVTNEYFPFVYPW